MIVWPSFMGLTLFVFIALNFIDNFILDFPTAEEVAALASQHQAKMLPGLPQEMLLQQSQQNQQNQAQQNSGNKKGKPGSQTQNGKSSTESPFAQQFQQSSMLASSLSNFTQNQAQNQKSQLPLLLQKYDKDETLQRIIPFLVTAPLFSWIGV